MKLSTSFMLKVSLLSASLSISRANTFMRSVKGMQTTHSFYMFFVYCASYFFKKGPSWLMDTYLLELMLQTLLDRVKESILSSFSWHSKKQPTYTSIHREWMRCQHMLDLWKKVFVQVCLVANEGTVQSNSFFQSDKCGQYTNETIAITTLKFHHL